MTTFSHPWCSAARASRERAPLLTVPKYTYCVGRRLFPFRNRSLPFLMVEATIGNQAFSHDGCNTVYSQD